MAKIITFPNREQRTAIKNKIATQANNNELLNETNDKKSTGILSRLFLSLFFLVRYAVALALFFAVGLPLAILYSFGFLIKLIGTVVMFGVTAVYFYNGDVSGWVVLGGWLLIGLTSAIEDVMNWWMNSGFAFKVLCVGKK